MDRDVDAVSAKFDFGRVISRTFSVLSRNFVPFFLMALVLEGIPTFLSSAIPSLTKMSFSFGLDDLPEISFSWSLEGGTLALLVIGRMIIVFTLYMLAYTTLVGALIHASIEGFKGETVGIRESLRIGLGFRLNSKPRPRPTIRGYGGLGRRLC